MFIFLLVVSIISKFRQLLTILILIEAMMLLVLVLFLNFGLANYFILAVSVIVCEAAIGLTCLVSFLRVFGGDLVKSSSLSLA
uniref:NADH dehydrogenase subunit 4L n=1 Tax=Eleutherocaulis alte TaxID=74076 RepID=A0A1P7YWC8_9EUPU|nr:NADH dehydrogenase subunit 4L [Eleutherocaulis alte]AKM99600.1 NADH dehydrogenase subunit 4L [Eleutherocaulis alte]WDD39313.1 NADH dehydrogenase subunit 4L [Eleutherocaulis alte]